MAFYPHYRGGAGGQPGDDAAGEGPSGNEPSARPTSEGGGETSGKGSNGEPGAGPRRGRELGVVHRDALGQKPVAEVTHRGQKDRDPGFVRPDVGRFLGHLGHPDAVAGLVKPVESR